jgi:hypothetical protein
MPPNTLASQTQTYENLLFKRTSRKRKVASIVLKKVLAVKPIRLEVRIGGMNIKTGEELKREMAQL